MIILKNYSFIGSKLVIFHDMKQKAMVYTGQPHQDSG